jgi:hypothetical protein
MDRVNEILIEVLKQALSADAEQRLYRSGKLDGLFPGRGGTSAEAAAMALRDGLLEVVRTEVKGKTIIDWVRLTPRGVEHLHAHESPVQALHELRESLCRSRDAVPVWLSEMRAALRALEEQFITDAQKSQQRLDALTRRVDDALRRLAEATPVLPKELSDGYPWSVDALDYLDRRRHAGALGPCPLPELHESLRRTHPALSIGHFHEGLRRLHERRVLRLQPTAGLADLPRPEFALFDDGAVLYYAAR